MFNISSLNSETGQYCRRINCPRLKPYHTPQQVSINDTGILSATDQFDPVDDRPGDVFKAATRTVSPSLAVLSPVCMVGWSSGTWMVVAEEIAEKLKTSRVRLIHLFIRPSFRILTSQNSLSSHHGTHQPSIRRNRCLRVSRWASSPGYDGLHARNRFVSRQPVGR